MKHTVRVVSLGALAAGFVGLLTLRVLDALPAFGPSNRQPTPLPVPVSVAVAARRDIAARVALTGVIRPRNDVHIFTKLPGRVEMVLVRVGDRVAAGQALAVIEHLEASLRAEQAQAQQQAALAALERAKIALEAAAASRRRYEVLRRERILPEADFERIEFALREAQAGVLDAESQMRTARAAVALAAEAVRNSRITTPVAGVVTRRLVNVGTEAAPGAPLFQVQDVAVLKLESAVPASDFARLRRGLAAQVTVSDLPGAVFRGCVSTLSPSLDPQTRRAAVEISVSNPDSRLLPNMFGQAVIEVARREGAVAIPERALVNSPAGRVIFAVRDGKAVELRPRLGGSDAGFVAVDSGLVQGESVVIAGQAGLRNGAPVRLARP